MSVRDLIVGLGFEFDKKSESEVHGVIEGVKKAALALGAAFTIKQIGDLITGTVDQVAQLGSSIGELSQKVGVSSEALQALGHVAKDNGSSMEGLATAMKSLSKNAVDAKDGGEGAAEAFKKAGIAVTDANGQVRPAEEMFIELADSFKGMTNETERTVLAQKLLGKSGTDMLPTLLMGSEALAEQTENARALGLVMSNELIEASAAFTRASNNQEGAMQGLRNVFAQELLPLFTELKIEGTKFIVKVLQPLVRQLGKGLALAFGTVHKALGSVLSLLRPVVEAFGKLTSGLKGVISAGELVGAMIIGLAALLAAKSLAMAASWLIANAPLLLTILFLALIATAIGLLIEDFVKMGEGAESVSGTMVQGFIDLIDEVGSVPSAIAEMLKTALDYWFGHESAIRTLFGGLFDWLAEQFNAVTDIFVNLFDGNLRGALVRFGEYLKRTFIDPLVGLADMLGIKGNISGIMDAGKLALQGMGGGTQNSMNHAGNNVSVVVNGASDPAAVGRAVGGAVGNVFEDDLRMSQNNFVTAAP
jgi:uncharacterized protein YoxC